MMNQKSFHYIGMHHSGTQFQLGFPVASPQTPVAPINFQVTRSLECVEYDYHHCSTIHSCSLVRPAKPSMYTHHPFCLHRRMDCELIENVYKRFGKAVKGD